MLIKSKMDAFSVVISHFSDPDGEVSFLRCVCECSWLSAEGQGTVRRCDQGSKRIPGGHPSAMFLHDLSIRPIDPSHY